MPSPPVARKSLTTIRSGSSSLMGTPEGRINTTSREPPEHCARTRMPEKPMIRLLR